MAATSLSNYVFTSSAMITSILGRWDFEIGINGTVAYDVSGQGLNGSMINGVRFIGPGGAPQGEYVVFLNATLMQYILLPPVVVYEQETRMMWIRTTTNSSFASLLSLTDDMSVISSEFRLHNSCVSFLLFTGPTMGFTSPSSNCTLLDDGQWHHVAMTRSGSLVTLFVDGRVELAQNLSLNLDAILNVTKYFTHMSIGARYFSTIESTRNPLYFNGELDDVRIYNYVLMASDIAAIGKWSYIYNVCLLFACMRIIFHRIDIVG